MVRFVGVAPIVAVVLAFSTLFPVGASGEEPRLASYRQAKVECPEGWKRFEDRSFGYAACVPDRWASRSRGGEVVWTAAKGAEVAIGKVIKTRNEEETASGVRSYFLRNNGTVEKTPRGLFAYSLNGVRGTVWARQAHRFGVVAYSACSGAADTCRALDRTAKRMVDTMRFAGLEGTKPFEEWSRVKTKNLVLLAPPKSQPEADLKWLAPVYQKGYETIVKALGIEPDDNPILCYFYPTKAALWLYNRRESGFAFLPAGEVHSWFISRAERQSTGHEMTHVIAWRAWGEPSQALLGEGVAVAMDLSTIDPSQAFKEAVGKKLASFSLKSLLGQGFFEAEPTLAYKAAGSFVKYLLKAYGVKSFVTFYKAPDIEKGAVEAYQKTLAQLELGWKASLESKTP